MIKIDYADQATWDLIRDGQTKGVFQCESGLVQSWLKKIKPNNIWELSIVIAIVRPGPLQSGFADDYLEYRNGTKPFVSFGHPIIDETFNITDHVLTFQEQIMSLGSRLAWQHLDPNLRDQKVDVLRKAVGKKNQQKLLEIGHEFVEGCIANKVDKELAEKLFEIIKNCGRYLFNLSHSIAYAHVSYKTAYLKAHYPLQFYATYLTYAKFKMHNHEEIFDLVQDAHKNNIQILPPNINKKNEHFRIEGDKIRFGLSHMKYFGTKTMDHLKNLPIINSWKHVFLLCLTDFYGFKLNVRTAEALINCGAFNDTKISRITLNSMLKSMKQLTDKEIEWVKDNLHLIDEINEFKTLLYSCAENKCNKKRRPKVESIAELFEIKQDNAAWIEHQERNLLGSYLTATAIDSKTLFTTDKCEDCTPDTQLWQQREVAVILDKVILTETKKGKNPGQKMARIYVYDSSGRIDNIPVFPETFNAVQDLLIENNTVLITIKMGRTGWMLEKMEQI